MTIDQLNALSTDEAVNELLRCCGSTRWAQLMAGRRPFASPAAMSQAADEVWRALGSADWLEAFGAHPRIGDPRGDWAAREQAGVAAAGDAVRARLAQANRAYEARFGYIFIVCATGRSTVEMLAMLEARMQNEPDEELKAAAAEQARITQLRLREVVSERG